MKTKLIVLLFAAGLLAVPLASQADDSSGELVQKLSQLVKTGQWKTTATINTSVVGTNMELPARSTTSKECVDQDDLKELAAPDFDRMDCEMTRQELTGKTLHIAMTCDSSQGNFTLNGKTVFTSPTSNTTHFVMQGKMHGMTVKIVAEGTSKRIGACTEDSDDD